jgi:DNA-binding NtrC family response regulator
MAQILIVDDVVAMAQQYAYDLARLSSHEVVTAASGSSALDLLSHEDIDCVILDLEMPGMDGFEVLQRMRSAAINVPVIVYTAAGNYDRCVRAVRLGAYTFIDKADPMERVALEVDKAIEHRAILREVRSLRDRARDESALVGDSAPMRKLRDAIAKVA